jgi:hypothetical protein
MNLPVINSHNGWSRLQEAWLGDVYPAAWYDHLPAPVRDVFYQLTEITKQDLSAIQTCMESFGVTVRRPNYTNIENHLIGDGQLIKPSICPRDDFLVVGNTLYRMSHDLPHWQAVLDQYAQDPQSKISVTKHAFINGANVVRVGQDVIVDTDHQDLTDPTDLFPGYRTTIVNNGGHLDGCFSTLRPGLLLANRYFSDHEKTFPGWEIIMLNDSTYAHARSRQDQLHPISNGKFWDTTVGSNRSFNQHIIQHALDWVGCYTETYFELNCLVIDEHNVIMLAENEALAQRLHSYGICVHWVPFRTRSFWDGAMHCLTVDIRRQSTRENFFPERG